jgi:hypothetical protein
VKTITGCEVEFAVSRGRNISSGFTECDRNIDTDVGIAALD